LQGNQLVNENKEAGQREPGGQEAAQAAEPPLLRWDDGGTKVPPEAQGALEGDQVSRWKERLQAKTLPKGVSEAGGRLHSCWRDECMVPAQCPKLSQVDSQGRLPPVDSPAAAGSQNVVLNLPLCLLPACLPVCLPLQARQDGEAADGRGRLLEPWADDGQPSTGELVAPGGEEDDDEDEPPPPGLTGDDDVLEQQHNPPPGVSQGCACPPPLPPTMPAAMLAALLGEGTTALPPATWRCG